MTDNTTLPTVEYNESFVDTMNSRDLPKEGWVRGMVTRTHRDITKTNKHLHVRLTVAPLDEDDNPVTKASAPLDLYLPIPNPAEPTHKPPKTARQLYFLARAVDPDFPRYARKGDGGKYISPTGDIIDLDTRNQINREVDKAVAMFATKLWNEPDTMKEEVFFACIDHEKGNDGKTYPRISRTRMEEPDEDVRTSDFIE